MHVPKFALILVGYTAAKTRAALQFCDAVSRGLRVARRVLVDNRPQELRALHAESEAHGWQVLEGSNRLHEFSGWQEGLDALAARGGEATHTLFVNDTVVSHRFFTPWRMRALCAALEAMDAGCKRMVGFTDRANGVFAIDGRAFERWVSTYCFALSARALQLLDRRLLDMPAAERYVVGGADEDRFLSDTVSDALHAHYRWWLFRGGWYRSAPLTPATSARLVTKARCMLLEHLLTVRCIELGIDVVDPFDRRQSLLFLDRTTRYVGRQVTRVARSISPTEHGT